MALSFNEEFQTNVALLVARNNNILDILTKYQDSCAKVCRTTIKSATGCGCISISAKKMPFDIEKIKTKTPKELSGTIDSLCTDCKERLENDIGESLFYIAALCNAMEISMKEIMKKEIKNVEILGKYSLK